MRCELGFLATGPPVAELDVALPAKAKVADALSAWMKATALDGTTYASVQGRYESEPVCPRTVERAGLTQGGAKLTVYNFSAPLIICLLSFAAAILVRTLRGVANNTQLDEKLVTGVSRLGGRLGGSLGKGVAKTGGMLASSLKVAGIPTSKLQVSRRPTLRLRQLPKGAGGCEGEGGCAAGAPAAASTVAERSGAGAFDGCENEAVGEGDGVQAFAGADGRPGQTACGDADGNASSAELHGVLEQNLQSMQHLQALLVRLQEQGGKRLSA